jgi:hypothetical protein
MRQENNMYYADGEKNLIVRKKDQFIMGPAVFLGETDQIENYEEKSFSDEELRAFYESIGEDYEIQT